jgi:hypothetical protein
VRETISKTNLSPSRLISAVPDVVVTIRIVWREVEMIRSLTFLNGAFGISSMRRIAGGLQPINDAVPLRLLRISEGCDYEECGGCR